MISKCGVGSRKMGVDDDCRGGAGMREEMQVVHGIWFQSLKKKQSPPPAPVSKKKQQSKPTSLSSRTPPRF